MSCVAYNLIEKVNSSAHRGRLLFVRLFAVACLFALLLVSFAATIHNHAPGQDDTCLLCHVSDHATEITAAHDAGKPLATATSVVLFAGLPDALADGVLRTSASRAPPASSFFA
jgi:hypothetical protein